MRRRNNTVLAAGLAFVDKATSTTDQITIPSGASEDDLAVLFDYAIDNSPNFSTPTGWTDVGTESSSGGGGGGCRISYKVLGVSDPGSTITGSNNDTNKKVMLVFTGNSVTVTPASSLGS